MLSQAGLGQRLDAVEQAVGHLAQKQSDGAPLLQALQALSHRLEALEKDRDDLLAELRGRLSDPIHPAIQETALQPPMIEPPVDEPMAIEPPYAPDFEDLFAQTPQQPANFLSRARRTARGAPQAPHPRYLVSAAVAGLVVVLALAVGLGLHRRVEQALPVKRVAAFVRRSLR